MPQLTATFVAHYMIFSAGGGGDGGGVNTV